MEIDEIKKLLHVEKLDSDDDKAVFELRYTSKLKNVEKVMLTVISVMACKPDLKAEELDFFFKSIDSLIKNKFKYCSFKYLKG